MNDFNEWLAQFADEDTDDGEFARGTTAWHRWPKGPETSYDRFFMSIFAPDVHAPDALDVLTLGKLWGRFLSEVLKPAPVPSSLSVQGQVLALFLEDGDVEKTVALCRTTELTMEERDVLLSRALHVRRLGTGDQKHRDVWGEGGGNWRDRVSRMSAFVVCHHPDAAEAARALYDSPLDDEAVVDALKTRSRAWLQDFAHQLVRHSRYGLLQRLARQFGIEVVAPPPELVAECLYFHIRSITDAGESGAVIGERLRDDPLAVMVLPCLRVRHAGVECVLGDNRELSGVRLAAEKVIAAAITQGIVDRRALIDELNDGLCSRERARSHALAAYVSLMQHLKPSEEELAPSLELWAELSTEVPGMDKGILRRSVTAMAHGNPVSGEQVAEWLRILREGSAGLTANAVVALTVLADDRRSLADEQAADVLRFVTDGPSSKATSAMTCIQAFLDAGRLTGEQIADCAAEVLFRPERSLANAMIKLLGGVLRADPGRIVALSPALAAAFAHPSADTQEKALALAERYHDRLDETARVLLVEAAEHLGPAQRDRAVQALGGGASFEGELSPYEETLPPITALERIAPPTGELGEVVADLAVWLRGRHREPARWERALDDLVRHAHRDRTALAEALAPVLKCCARHPEVAASAKPLLLAAALTAADTPHPADRVPDELIARHDDRHTHAGCGREVFDRVFQARMNELWRRITDHDVPPLLLATPTWTDGTIAPGELVDRLATYEALAARPGTADFDQALLRVRHDDTAATAADRADALTLPEAGRLAHWLRTGGLTPPSTTRRVYADLHPDHYHDRVLYRLREEIRDDADMPAGMSEPFRRLTDPFVAEWDSCLWHTDPWTVEASLPLLLTFLPAHRELVTARMLPGFADAAELEYGNVVGDLPVLVDTDGPLGAAVHLALAYGLGAGRALDRVAAADALLIMAARGSLDADRLGHDVADLAAHGTLKAGRVAVSLSLAAQSGAHLTVGAVLAAALPALLPEPGAKTRVGLAELLTLTAECAEATRRMPAVDGIAELAARKGSSLYLKAARRLHTACTRPT
ncbi:DUF7824 domain-containing protein [Streptomyces cadmiisoli]|uniref:DUF7824 domain-containing protein n=1 Tax=Streptomyces cadmiisoli TaxID=2184053 RepID=UPI00364B90CB